MQMRSPSMCRPLRAGDLIQLEQRSSDVILGLIGPEHLVRVARIEEQWIDLIALDANDGTQIARGSARVQALVDCGWRLVEH